MEKKRNIVESAMHYRQIVMLVTVVLIVFGIYGLYSINKNEFPNITIRQGVVVAVYPGKTAIEVEEQLTRPLENYIFTYKEVNKAKTKSFSRDGMVIVQVELNEDLKDKDEFWAKFKHGVNAFKSSLPSGVLAVVVNDDFGDTSALLVTMESQDKTYRELQDYANDLMDSLRTIESVGRMTVSGTQQEQISVYLNYNKIAKYGISDNLVAATLLSKNFVTTAGTLKNGTYNSPVYISQSINLVSDIEETIVYSSPVGNIVRLKDIAEIRREYPKLTSFVTNNGVKCIVLSIELKSGRSITDMGEEVYKVLDNFEPSLPDDVKMFRITDQAKVVKDSVVSFLEELLIAIVAVIIVVVLLMPMRVALVAAATIPISIFISLGLYYAFDIELNTVTLAALITTLGMIVDNSIVIIDAYVEKMKEGTSRWHSAIYSATHFFPSVLTATLAISITFFPFLITTKGSFNDTLQTFPWAISIVLLVSLFVAVLLVPFLQFWFIKKENAEHTSRILDFLQNIYDKIIDWCFLHKKTVIVTAFVSVIAAAMILMKMPQRLMPLAERNQFAVEIYLPTGTSIDRTAALADSLENILHQDDRVVSIASFKGGSSPRFHTVYAPQFGGENYAQFIVNTVSPKATEAMLAEYKPRFEESIPEAYVRFKQLSYGAEANPIEIRLSGGNLNTLKCVADSLTKTLRQDHRLKLVRNDLNEPLQSTKIKIDPQKASRLGIAPASVELAMAMRYNASGIPIATIWQGDYPVSVCLKSTIADKSDRESLENQLISAEGGLRQVPLRQIADIDAEWSEGQISHRNGIRTVTIMSEVREDLNCTQVTMALQNELAKYALPEGVTMTWGGEIAENNSNLPTLISALIIAVAIIFFLLIYHYKRTTTPMLLLVSLSLCFFGTAVGIYMHGSMTMTCFLGFISLMGILVRNAIIMYDYAEELRTTEKLSPEEAIHLSAKRRMRPIFLTSAAASMGVVPMIISNSSLWGPMGSVIFYGTIITMFFILTVLPVAYAVVLGKSAQKRAKEEAVENN